MVKNWLLFGISSTLALNTAFAGPIKLVQTAEENQQIASGIGSTLGTPFAQPEGANVPKTAMFYQTFPFSSFLNLNNNDSNQVDFTTGAVNEASASLLANYVSLIQETENDQNLGLRVLLAPQENRAAVSQALAESNLVQTGDIIVSMRPGFAQSLRYLALQLLSTHISVAVVQNENGKRVVYNIDMPMDADMLGGKAGHGYSKLDSNHFTADNRNLALHILRPRLTETQKKNMQAWLDLSLMRAREKSIYPSKISFNTNYESPMFRDLKDLVFVGDLGRLLLSGAAAKPTQHLQMYCSEFAWAILSLRDCNPQASSEFSNKQPGCIKPFFNPMMMFGSSFSQKNPADPDFAGMTDGVMLLAKANSSSNPEKIAQLINQSVPADSDVKTSAPGLSNGHREVAEMMKPLINQANPYFTKAVLSGQPEMIDGFRGQLNPHSLRNYSPTAFVVHALLPDSVEGEKVRQKALDYVVTIKYVPGADQNVKRLKTIPGI